ncbi:MAG: hypothetical protein R3C28_19265 [Pirellulaceae bacterium]
MEKVREAGGRWKYVDVAGLDPGYTSLVAHWWRHLLGIQRVGFVEVINSDEERFPDNLHRFAYLNWVKITNGYAVPKQLSGLANIEKLRWLSLSGHVYDTSTWPAIDSLHWIWVSEADRCSGEPIVGPYISGHTVDQICRFASRTPSVRQLACPVSPEIVQQMQQQNSRCAFIIQPWLGDDSTLLYSPVFDCPITKYPPETPVHDDSSPANEP